MGLLDQLLRSRRRATEPLPGPVTHNLAVVSDLHMGEDIAEFGSTELLGYIEALNRELAGFVEHLRGHPADERPWLLVFNGDAFDFLKLSLRASPPRSDADWLRHQAEATGGGTPAELAWKMRRICEVHLPVMTALARLLDGGHRVAFLSGNHDIELYFPEVQRALRDYLLERARHERRATRRPPLDEQQAEEFAGRISFHRWFVAEGGLFHLEHGHLYDEYCSLEFPLIPLDKAGAKQIAMPIGQKAMPYFADLLADFSTHRMEKMGAIELLASVLRNRLWLLWAIVRAYFVAAYDLLHRAGLRRRLELRSLAAAHAKELDDFARHVPYTLEQLRAVAALRKRPVEYSLARTVSTLYFDRVLAVAAYAAAVPALLALPFGLGWLGRALALAAVTGLFAGALAVLARWRRQDQPGDLLRAAGRIAALVAPRFVIMGHTHEAVCVELPRAPGAPRPTIYLNTGAWVTREVAAGEGMSYVTLTAAGASLCRWRGAGADPPCEELCRHAL